MPGNVLLPEWHQLVMGQCHANLEVKLRDRLGLKLGSYPDKEAPMPPLAAIKHQARCPKHVR